MLSYGARKHRRRLKRFKVLVPSAVLLGSLAVVAALLFGSDRDVNNSDVEFIQTTTVQEGTKPSKGQRAQLNSWPLYGYDLLRASNLQTGRDIKPPFKTEWKIGGGILLEFSPVMDSKSLYLLKNNGALHAINKSNGKVRWKRKLGSLAASSPAYSDGQIFVVTLKRKDGSDRGQVFSLRASDGKIVWSKDLPSRAESSPLVYRNRLYFGSEDGTVYALKSSNGNRLWTYKAAGAVKAGLAFTGGKLIFGDYGGQVHAVRAKDGKGVWSTESNRTRFGIGARGNFYSTPAIAYGRVYLGNTDGKVYSFSTKDGALAWTKTTGSYVYSSPAIAEPKPNRQTVFIGSYDGNFYALNARDGTVRWRYSAGNKISGGATVIDRIVYFAVLDAHETVGLDTVTGKAVFHDESGSFNPVISDGHRVFLTGYSSLQSLRPKLR